MKKQDAANQNPESGRHEETIADRIFDQVVAEIFSGSLRPKDSLTERDLVSRFGASRTPVREALKRLRERGFLTVGRRGISRVREMSHDEVEELYALRVRLERIAAFLAARNITDHEIAELKRVTRQFAATVETRNLIAMLKLRSEFHAILAGATGNRWLADVLIILRQYAYPVRHAHWQDITRAAHAIGLHEEMIRCLVARDGKRFRLLVISQITEALDVYRDRLTPSAPAPFPARLPSADAPHPGTTERYSPLNRSRNFGSRLAGKV